VHSIKSKFSVHCKEKSVDLQRLLTFPKEIHEVCFVALDNSFFYVHFTNMVQIIQMKYFFLIFF